MYFKTLIPMNDACNPTITKLRNCLKYHMKNYKNTYLCKGSFHKFYSISKFLDFNPRLHTLRWEITHTRLQFSRKRVSLQAKR